VAGREVFVGAARAAGSESSVSVGHLAQLAEVHGSDAVADALDDGQVVADDDQMSLWMSAPAGWR